MTMTKKKKALIVLIGLILLWGMMISTDAIRASHWQRPIFARYEIAYDDGGSVEYIGLFYKVYFVHQLCYGKWENTKAFHNKRYVIFQKVGPWFEKIGTMIDREYDKYEKIDEATSE